MVIATGELPTAIGEFVASVNVMFDCGSMVSSKIDTLLEVWFTTAKSDVSPCRKVPATIAKRSTHVVRENQRTLDAAHAFTAGDLDRTKKLMRDSHASLRDLYEVSCRELDIMVDAAEGLPGYCGGRMTGGGFGGCTVNLVREEHADHFAQGIAERYRQSTGINPDVYLCTAEDGAGEIT